MYCMNQPFRSMLEGGRLEDLVEGRELGRWMCQLSDGGTNMMG